MCYYQNCGKIRSVKIRSNLHGTGPGPQNIVLLRELCYYLDCYYTVSTAVSLNFLKW